MKNVSFNKPLVFGNEMEYIEQAIRNKTLSGDGEFTLKCCKLMEEKFNARKVILTTSCTHALEMASILIDLQPDDEVICPSYTFVSTINSFVLRGAKPIFVDIREDTLNIDETLIEEKITDKTKAIFPIHYGGISCEMDEISKIASNNNLFVIEDSAQGVNAEYKNKFLGTLGDMGVYSFHESKNYTCGEGGALLLNNEKFIERAEIIREKGTDRSKFFRGEIDKYNWIDIGSSWLPSDILAAYLYGQLLNMDKIKDKRKVIFDYYYDNLENLEKEGAVRLPITPEGCNSSYHMFYILLSSRNKRNSMLKELKQRGIHSVFHYLPLHTSPMGRKFGYTKGDLPFTEDLSDRILRLPFHYGLTRSEQKYVVDSIYEILGFQTQ